MENETANRPDVPALASLLAYPAGLAALLTFVYRPVCSRHDVDRVGWMLLGALAASTAWETLLTAHRVLSAPALSLSQYAAFKAAFGLRTYNACLVYLVFNKTTLHAAFLDEIRGQPPPRGRRIQTVVGCVLLAMAIKYGMGLVERGGVTAYLGWMLVCMGPPLLLLRSLSYPFIRALPRRATFVPILLSTLSEWLSMQPSWVSPGSKLGCQIFYNFGPETEELLLVLLANILLVWCLASLARAHSLVLSFPSLYPSASTRPSLFLLTKALLRRYPAVKHRYNGLREAADLLENTSTSFYYAACLLEGRLQLDAIGLYAFTRAACDLMDDAPDADASSTTLQGLREFVAQAYSGDRTFDALAHCAASHFPRDSRDALLSLPHELLPEKPLQTLLLGFATDTKFPRRELRGTGAHPPTAASPGDHPRWPIATNDDLHAFLSAVSGSIGELAFGLVRGHRADVPAHLLSGARRLSVALQCVALARDVDRHAVRGRVYLPQRWLEVLARRPADLVRAWDYDGNFEGELGGAGDSGLADDLDRCRVQLLYDAERLWGRGTEDLVLALPAPVAAPFRLAFEGYWDVRRAILEGRPRRRAGSRLRWFWKVANGKVPGAAVQKGKTE